MCGRFNFTGDALGEFMADGGEDLGRVKTGEVRPSELAVVLMKGMKPVAMTWGFPHFKGTGVIFNARCETVAEKEMFRSSVLERRCVIPSNGFYEWGEAQTSLFSTPKRGSAKKTKYLFRLPGEEKLYMAGFWKSFRDRDGTEKKRFVIITTEANESVRDIHDRMPVVLRPDECKQWFAQGVNFAHLFDREAVLLEREPV